MIFNCNLFSSLSLAWSNNISKWAGEQVSKWVWTHTHKQEGILKNIPCHIMEYSQYIHLPHGNNIWCSKIFHSHGIFYHITCMICWGINNDLLILNMDLANIIVNSSIMWKFGVKRKYKDAYYHSQCNQCSKYLRFLYNTFNIFKIIEMTRNNMPKKYLMNLNL